MTIVLFLIVLAFTFGLILFFTRPTKEETELGNRLDVLGRTGSVTSTPVDSDILKREVYSDLPLVNALLARVKLAADLDTLIKQSDTGLTVGRVLFGSLVIAIMAGVVAAGYFHNSIIGVIVGIPSAAIPYIYLRVKRAARLRAFEDTLPEAIDLLSRALKAGHALTAAIEMVAREIADPVGGEFRRVYEEQNFGLPIREALQNLAERVPVADLRFLVTAMLVQKETGGNLAEVLDKTSAVIRERSRLLGQLRIYTAQGRMTGWVLGLLPFALAVLMNFIKPGHMQILFNDPLGRKAIWIALTLMTFGTWWIRKIVNIKV
jgi:tight adherence protein B